MKCKEADSGDDAARPNGEAAGLASQEEQRPSECHESEGQHSFIVEGDGSSDGNRQGHSGVAPTSTPWSNQQHGQRGDSEEGRETMGIDQEPAEVGGERDDGIDEFDIIAEAGELEESIERQIAAKQMRESRGKRGERPPEHQAAHRESGEEAGKAPEEVFTGLAAQGEDEQEKCCALQRSEELITGNSGQAGGAAECSDEESGAVVVTGRGDRRVGVTYRQVVACDGSRERQVGRKVIEVGLVANGETDVGEHEC